MSLLLFTCRAEWDGIPAPSTQVPCHPCYPRHATRPNPSFLGPGMDREVLLLPRRTARAYTQRRPAPRSPLTCAWRQWRRGARSLATVTEDAWPQFPSTRSLSLPYMDGSTGVHTSRPQRPSSCPSGRGRRKLSAPRLWDPPRDERMRRHHRPGTPTKQGTCALVDGSMEPARLYSSGFIVILQLHWLTIG